MTARVESIARVAWYPDDEDLQGARVVGRCEVNFAGGGRVDAIVVRHVRHGNLAVFWERTSRRFVGIELDVAT